jgi:D-beta-D-heptose 7-phosphate kinase/D-beta-D-heptose 1-phosphate adenosyltransferase
MHLLDISKKVVRDPKALVAIAEGLRALGCKIVVTIGSWDMLHVGHARYLKKAKELGDVLIVGTDSNRGIKLYKGPSRPMVSEEERLEMLSYMDFIDFTIIVDDIDSDGKWQYGLIDLIKPDIFVAVEGSYPDEQIKDIAKYCGKVIMLPRQAETSTSNLIYKAMKEIRVQ